MEKVHVVSVITLPEMLWFLVLITVHHLILIIEKNNCLVLGERPKNSLSDSNGAAGKK